MSILTDARQYVQYAIVDFAQTELPTGVAVPVLDIPQGSTVVAIDVVIDTAFNSVTSDTIDIGDASLATRYDTAINGQTAGSLQAGTPTGFETTSSEPQIVLTNTAVGTEGTLGAGRLIVAYVNAGRHDENFGDGVEFQGAPA
jgi:hypothetical protein